MHFIWKMWEEEKLILTFSNIHALLQSYTAKISDFGLAKLGPSASQSHVTTRVMGTYGYAAPEYVATGNAESSVSDTLKIVILAKKF